MRLTAGNGWSNATDLYNSASGTWSTAQLSVARSWLAATTVRNVAIFAGGDGGNCIVAIYHGGFASELLCVDDAFFEIRDCCCFVVYAVQEVAVS